jgi:hypothetical protein
LELLEQDALEPVPAMLHGLFVWPSGT